jgi:hypothetical protein
MHRFAGSTAFGAAVLALACARPKSAPTASCVHGCEEVERVAPCPPRSQSAPPLVTVEQASRYVGRRVSLVGRLALQVSGALLIDCYCCGGWVRPRLALTERGGMASSGEPVVAFEGWVKASSGVLRPSECHSAPGSFVLRYSRRDRIVSPLGNTTSPLLVTDSALAGKSKSQLAGLGDRITDSCCSIDAADLPVVATGQLGVPDDPSNPGTHVTVLKDATVCVLAR